MRNRIHLFEPPSEIPEVVLAAVVARLPAVVFSGRTAGWLHGLDVAALNPVEVTLPREAGIASRSGIRVDRTRLHPDQVTIVRGFRVTSPLRTVVDLGGRSALVEAVVFIDMALHNGLVRLSDLDRHVHANPHRKGVRRLREAIRLADSLAESPMETRLRLLLVFAGLPRPQCQVTIRDAWGRVLARPDLLYPAEKLVIEFDGGTHRNSLVEDDRRQNRLISAGYRLLRFTGADLLGNPAFVVSQVRDELAGIGRPMASLGR